ncbi:MAG: YtxH domain-containing protein [Candidatus Pacebacteria bacterium]|nr:YtxH domain-containing protein [Candidatus Paceibacterota bacterium]
MTEEKKKSSGKKVAAGVAAGVVAGIVAGILLAPKKGKETREDLKKAVEKNKFTKEVIERLKKIEDITKEKYEKVVDEVSDFYRRLKRIKNEDIKEIADDLKGRWPEISKKLKGSDKKAKSVKTNKVKSK